MPVTGADLVTPGRFVVGCNYWASHAGTRMWADWDEAQVADDLTRLANAGLQLLRVFPLWPDFQPIEQLYGGGGSRVEFRCGEQPLGADALGRAGLSAVMMDRFARFADLAAERGLRLLVGLLTGWMSGRLYLPSGLAGRNPLTDAVAIEWELRFVRAFVGHFAGQGAIVAWDLGNECNCLGGAGREQAAVWTATIANAIRCADPTRPVVSGMHSLTPTGAWTAADQGEWTDLLCTHPYPVFTPHCDQDPVNTLRTTLHGTAESRFYADLGDTPCLCQEIGTLGPMIASEAVAAAFIRTCLFSLWANDCHGLLWWCAHEQSHLPHAPYDWCAVERELGLLRADGRAKPVLNEITAFRRLLDGLPCDTLPPRTTEAVCLLSHDQDHWGVAYSTFILAKQAGFDLTFCHSEQPLPEAPLYLLPALSGHRLVSRRRWLELKARIEAGATLYLSLDSGLPSDFEPLCGLEPQTRERRRPGDRQPVIWDNVTLPVCGDFKVRFEPTRATVLAREADGSPALSVATLGRGKVVFCGLPLEPWHTRTPGAFEESQVWRLYRWLAEDALAGRAVRKEHPAVALTEHRLADGSRLAIAINHSPAAVEPGLAVGAGWRVAEWLYGVEGVIGANEAVIARVVAGDRR
jgi:hypothetical protein